MSKRMITVLGICLILFCTGVLCICLFNRKEVADIDYKPITPMPEEDIIPIEDDPIASIKQQQEYYAKYTQEDFENSHKYYEQCIIDSAVFKYNYVAEDYLEEAPDWVTEDIITNYSGSREGFVMDDFMSANFQIIDKFCSAQSCDIYKINLRCNDKKDIIFTIKDTDYQVAMVRELADEGQRFTLYIVPMESDNED